jgi:hypothetical protein
MKNQMTKQVFPELDELDTFVPMIEEYFPGEDSQRYVQTICRATERAKLQAEYIEFLECKIFNFRAINVPK